MVGMTTSLCFSAISFNLFCGAEALNTYVYDTSLKHSEMIFFRAQLKAHFTHLYENAHVNVKSNVAVWCTRFGFASRNLEMRKQIRVQSNNSFIT